MPIPTRPLSTRSKLEASTVNRVASSRRAKLVESSTKVQDDDDQRSESSTASVTATKSTAQSRHVSRVQPKDASSTVRHTRIVSANVDQNTVRTDQTKTIVSLKPALSATSRPAAITQSRIATSASKATSATGQSRIRSTNAITTGNPLTSKIKAPSTSQLAPKPISKNTKTSSTVAATTRPTASNANLDTSPSVQRLQDELYQLQLVQAGSSQTLNQYKASINRKVTQRRTELLSQEAQILSIEASNLEALSIQALHDWFSETPLPSADKRIQLLSGAITELSQLMESDEALVPLQVFDHWLTEVLSIREDRKSSSSTSTELIFVRSLGHEWLDAMRVLQQSLGAILATLESFGDPKAGSGIEIFISRQRQLTRTLAQEVEIALVIEKSVMQAETSWEAEQLRVAIEHLNNGNESRGKEYRGIWAES